MEPVAKLCAWVMLAALPVAGAAGCEEEGPHGDEFQLGCCESCSSPVLEVKVGCEPGVMAQFCPKRSPCHDAYDYYHTGTKYCCRTDCDGPGVVDRYYMESVCIYAVRCPISSACYQSMTELAVEELSRTDDAWAIPSDAGALLPSDLAPGG